MEEIIKDPNRGSGAPVLRAGEVSESIPVPRRGGLIVGPGGVNIRRIKEESCADVQVDRATETAICT